MGVYSLNSIYESSTNFLEDVQIRDYHSDDYMEIAFQNIYESVCNHNAFMQSIGIAELAAFEATGEEMIYEAGALGGLIDKIKDILKKIWEKIKSLFTKFMAKLQSFSKDDKAFVTKYRKEIQNGSTKDLKIKGFKYTIDAVTVDSANGRVNTLDEVDMCSKILTNVARTTENMFDKLKDLDTGNSTTKFKTQNSQSNDVLIDGDKFETTAFGNKSDDDIYETIRGKALDKSAKFTLSEFNQELFELLRNGDANPQILDDKDINVGTIITTLMNTTTIEKGLKDDLKNIKKTVEDNIKDLDKAGRDILKQETTDDDIVKKNRGMLSGLFSRISRIYQEVLNTYQAISAARMKAFNDRRRQYKATCVKLIGRKSKNESYNYEDEYDYSYGSGDFESILGNVKLI